jgi:hypothetical protein
MMVDSSRPNPAAIAWYVEQSQRLLEDQQRRAESLRTRGGQLAGFGAAVLAVVGSNARSFLKAADGCTEAVIAAGLLGAVTALAISVAIAVLGAVKPRTFAAISAAEVANYTTHRFLNEPDVWRVHVRTLKALHEATTIAQEAGNGAAAAINHGLQFFLIGLAATFVAVAALIIGLIS